MDHEASVTSPRSSRALHNMPANVPPCNRNRSQHPCSPGRGLLYQIQDAACADHHRARSRSNASTQMPDTGSTHADAPIDHPRRRRRTRVEKVTWDSQTKARAGTHPARQEILRVRGRDSSNPLLSGQARGNHCRLVRNQRDSPDLRHTIELRPG